MHQIPHQILQSAGIGLALGSGMLGMILIVGGDPAAGMLAEAMARPWQLPAIWFGAVGPFAVAFAGTSLALRQVDVPPPPRRIRAPAVVRVR